MKYLLIKVDPEEYKKYIPLINPSNIIRTYDDNPEIFRNKILYEKYDRTNLDHTILEHI